MVKLRFMYGQIYRHLLLPFFDGALKKRKTLTYWKNAEASQWKSRQELEAIQLKALQDLLRHAQQTCPYYADQAKALNLSPEMLTSLADFTKWPLLTRTEIRQHRAQLRSTVASGLMTKATGGSSGEPLQFDIDNDSNDRRVAMTHRGYSWAGAPPGSKQLYIWGTSMDSTPTWKKKKIDLHHRLDNHLIISCFEFTPDRMHQHFQRMNRYRPEVIVAYTNPLYEFARFIESHSLTPVRPRSIVVGAEKLHDFQRTTIERVFGAPVFETYGSREFMLIGAECDKHTGLHLSMENLLVEILNDDGTLTPEGEEGNVVITDLFNYGMPFIRYVNGDRAVAGFDLCPCGRGLPLLKKVVGRQLDVLETPDGRKVPGEFFPHLIKEFPAIRRFQVIQDRREQIVLTYVSDDGLAPEAEAHLLKEIRLVTGTEVAIQLKRVEDIPLTKMGKLKVVVRNY